MSRGSSVAVYLSRHSVSWGVLCFELDALAVALGFASPALKQGVIIIIVTR